MSTSKDGYWGKKVMNTGLAVPYGYYKGEPVYFRDGEYATATGEILDEDIIYDPSLMALRRSEERSCTYCGSESDGGNCKQCGAPYD